MSTAREKFYTFGIGEVFFLNETPAGTNPDGSARKPVLVPCQKASAITFINLSEAFLGEVQYDASYAPKVLSAAEQSEVVKTGIAPQIVREAQTIANPLPPLPTLQQLSQMSHFSYTPPTAPVPAATPEPVKAAPAVKAAKKNVPAKKTVKKPAKKKPAKKAAKKAAKHR